MSCDFIVIGAGIVGIATAWKLQQEFPGRTVLVLEKEMDFRESRLLHRRDG